MEPWMNLVHPDGVSQCTHRQPARNGCVWIFYSQHREIVSLLQWAVIKRQRSPHFPPHPCLAVSHWIWFQHFATSWQTLNTRQKAKLSKTEKKTNYRSLQCLKKWLDTVHLAGQRGVLSKFLLTNNKVTRRKLCRKQRQVAGWNHFLQRQQTHTPHVNREEERANFKGVIMKILLVWVSEEKINKRSDQR